VPIPETGGAFVADRAGNLAWLAPGDQGFEAGMHDLLAWLEGQEAEDSVDAAREALVARGLAR